MQIYWEYVQNGSKNSIKDVWYIPLSNDLSLIDQTESGSSGLCQLSNYFHGANPNVIELLNHFNSCVSCEFLDKRL